MTQLPEEPQEGTPAKQPEPPEMMIDPEIEGYFKKNQDGQGVEQRDV